MNTTELLDQLSVAVRRDAARSHRRRRIAAVATALVVLGAGSVAVAGTSDGWWGEVASENASVGIDLDLSTRTTVAQAGDATLTAVATNGGKGYCLGLDVGAKSMGTSCTTTSDSEYRTRADDTHWIGYGRILDANAASLDMSGAGLPAKVPLQHGGFFLFDIPRDQWASLNERHGDIAILDGAGNTIRRACVWVGEAPGSLVSGGGTLGEAGQCDVPPPVDPVPVRSKAQRIVADGDVALWQAPSIDGRGTCWFTARTDSPAPVVGLGAGGCRSSKQSVEAPDAIAFMTSGDVVTGFVGRDVARVTIHGDGWSVDATLAQGAFIGRSHGGATTITAYDAAGNEVKSEVVHAR